jgi:hypothetical protein
MIAWSDMISAMTLVSFFPLVEIDLNDGFRGVWRLRVDSASSPDGSEWLLPA